MNVDKNMIGACGLICEGCDIMEASHNKDISERIAKWFGEELDIEVKPEDIHCQGCRGDREIHWSANCWILKCCVDDRGFDFCYECPEFPCEKLVEWSEENERYGEALERLREMKKKTG